MVKELVVAVLGGGVVALAGYLLGVKENQVNIDNLKSELAEIKAIGQKNQDSLVATKLFIAQAHPERDAGNLASVMKLKQLDKIEVFTLAESLPEIKFQSGPGHKLAKLPEELEALAKKHDFKGKDFASYAEIADLPVTEIKL